MVDHLPVARARTPQESYQHSSQPKHVNHFDHQNNPFPSASSELVPKPTTSLLARIGDAYQASILGQILGAEEEREIADEMDEGFKESLALEKLEEFQNIS